MGKVQRAAKRYDDGGHGKYDKSRPVFLAAIMGARALPPQTNRCRMTKRRGTGRSYSQLYVVLSRMDSEPNPIGS